MIEIKYYYDIYLFIITIITIVVANSYAKGDFNLPYSDSGIVIDVRAIILCIIIALYIGFRPINGFADTMVYVSWYDGSKGLIYNYDPLASNKIWNNLFNWWASNELGISNFFVLTAFIYFGCTYFSCRKFFNQDQYIAFLVFLASFSTFSYATNGIKAGAAGAIFLLGLSYYKKWIIGISLILISWGFHHSMILPVVAFAVAYLYRNSKFYYYFWIICLIISVLHITFFQYLFASMAEDQGDTSGVGYLMSSSADAWGGKTGFRIDFVIYSAMPILVGYYSMFKKKLKFSNTYKMLLNIYMLTNSVWMLCMYAQFTNRIAYLSWFMFPIVLIYPFLKEDWGPTRYQTLSKVVLANLGFTLFMKFIYYS